MLSALEHRRLIYFAFVMILLVDEVFWRDSIVAQVVPDDEAIFDSILDDSLLTGFNKNKSSSAPRFIFVTFAGLSPQANVIRVDADGTATDFSFSGPRAIKGTTRLHKTWKVSNALSAAEPDLAVRRSDIPISQRLVVFDFTKTVADRQLYDRRHLPDSVRDLLRAIEPGRPASFGKAISRIAPTAQVLLNRNISLQRSSHFGCSPDGHYYLLYQGDDSVEVIDALDGATINRLRPCKGYQVEECRFSHGGKFLAIRVNGLSQIFVFDVETWKLIAAPQIALGIKGSPKSIEFTFDDSQIVVVADEKIVIFDTQDFRPVVVNSPDGSSCRSAVVSEYGPMLLFIDSGQNVGIADLQFNSRKVIAQFPFGNIVGSISADGSSVAFFCKADGTFRRGNGSGLKLVATKTGKTVDLMRYDITPAIDANWVWQSSDERFTAAICHYSRLDSPPAGIDVWDNEMASHVARLTGATSCIVDVVPIDNGRKLLACTSKGDIFVWDWTKTVNHTLSEK